MLVEITERAMAHVGSKEVAGALRCGFVEAHCGGSGSSCGGRRLQQAVASNVMIFFLFVSSVVFERDFSSVLVTSVVINDRSAPLMAATGLVPWRSSEGGLPIPPTKGTDFDVCLYIDNKYNQV
jgi:hypothetical protein